MEICEILGIFLIVFILAQPITEDFIVHGLNRLIEKLSGVRDYIDPLELSANAYGRKGSVDNVTAERKVVQLLSRNCKFIQETGIQRFFYCRR